MGSNINNMKRIYFYMGDLCPECGFRSVFEGYCDKCGYKEYTEGGFGG